MTKHAYNRCNYDYYAYFKKISEGKMIYLLLYAGDMLIPCHDRKEIDQFEGLLSIEFEMKDHIAERGIKGWKWLEIERKMSCF